MKPSERVREIIRDRYQDDVFNMPDAILDYLDERVPPMPVLPKKHVLVNCINWGPLAPLPLDGGSEFTYFVLLVSKSGDLLFGNPEQEAKFVKDVHAAGRKATFSIAGGSQNVSDITTAVSNLTPRTALINAIHARIMAYGYDGVTVDIENTSITAYAMKEFIAALRVKIGPAAILGVYTQKYQKDTVWAQIDQVSAAITWLSPMMYDMPNTVEQAKAWTLVWLPRVSNDKSKLLFGAAVNYDATGQSIDEWAEILDWVATEGIGGVGVWQHTAYKGAWVDELKKRIAV